MDNPPPPPFVPASPYQSPQKPGWWSRNWKWLVPSGCVTLLLLVAVFALGIAMVVMTALKSSDAYKMALEKAKTSEQVQNALGIPITDGMFMSGNTNVNGASGNADLSVPLSGPKGSGTLYLTATKSEGDWTFSKLNVHVAKTGEVIDLLPAAPDGALPGNK